MNTVSIFIYDVRYIIMEQQLQYIDIEERCCRRVIGRVSAQS